MYYDIWKLGSPGIPAFHAFQEIKTKASGLD